jgi:light-regulated signal transduction histidine kinase (bacteriophytochrome)
MVSTFTELLRTRYAEVLDEQGQRYLEYARDGAQRMQRLIDDLLLYTRVRHQEVAHGPVDMNQLVDEIFEHARVASKEGLESLTRGDLPTVSGLQTQIAQLVQNLVSNALKFRGPDPPRVDVRARLIDDEWVFSVRDNGIGLRPEFSERAFQIFQRYHGRDEYPGTGIGLTIARTIVHRHGGRIWVESTPGEGATFYFTLPGPSRSVRPDHSA